MSELDAIEGALLDALATIRKHWDALLETASSAGGTPSTDDVTSLDKRLSLRGEVLASLNGWARLVMEDRPIRNPKALPLGDDPFGLIDFLTRHAGWMSGHECAGAAVGELTEWAQMVWQVAEPRVRDHVTLGPCPFVPDFGATLDMRIDGEPPEVCHGQVRAPIGGEDAACTDCGQVAVLGWWEDVLGLGQPPCTAPKMAEILHQRIGVRVTERTIRNWTRDGLIGPYAEPHPQPRWTRYDPSAVLAVVAMMGRPCAMCGKPWDGHGDLCRLCWTTATSGPTYAPERQDWPVVRSIRRTLVVADPDDTERDERCHWSDLILSQCACGRHGPAA